MALQTFDLESITLGEMVEVELASGHDFTDLLKSRTGRMMVVRFLLALRQHERDISSPAPVWEKDRPLLGGSSSTSPSLPDGEQPKSDG
jgi:hypothetical protein